MTTLIINDSEKYEVATSENESVFDVLVAAQDKWDSNHAINSLMVNGEKVEPLEEATLMAIPGHDIEVKITLSQPQARSLDTTISEAVTYMNRLHEGFLEVATIIRTENKPEAYNMMKDGLSGLSTILELIDHLMAQSETLPEDIGTEFENLITELQEKSEEMTDAQEGGDPTLIADILEYEIVDSVTELVEYIEKIKPYVLA